MRIGVIRFHVGEKSYNFKEELMLEIENVEEGGICLTNKELSLSACGKSCGECVDIIREELATLWEEYALAQDDELFFGAISFKNKLLRMVEEVK